MRHILPLAIVLIHLAVHAEVAQVDSQTPPADRAAEMKACLAAPSVNESVPKSGDFHQVAAEDLPRTVQEGDLDQFIVSAERQLKQCGKLDMNQTLTIGDRVLTRKQWCVDTNERLRQLAKQTKAEGKSFSEFMDKAKTEFDWYKSGCEDKTQFTGYHSPELPAKKFRDPKNGFIYPIYRQPKNLIRTLEVDENGKVKVDEKGKPIKYWRMDSPDGMVTKFWDRRSIEESGVLKPSDVIGYTNDKFSAFLLQVQGSGKLRFVDDKDKTVFVNFAAANGHTYLSPSKYLRCLGVPQESRTIPSMRKYFKDHPGLLDETLGQDPSFVFFQVEEDGPYGSSGVKLTPRHSLACPKNLPAGVIALFSAERPDEVSDNPADWKKFSSIANCQDEGGAINGCHIDVFWGSDDYAARAAGLMNRNGSFFLAVPKAAKIN